MIRSFRSRQLQRYWTRGDTRGLPADHIKRLHVRLTALDSAATPQEMNVPGWRFHALSGDMAGRYAVNVSGNWRLTFAWDGDGPYAIEVDYEDYH
jgi:proteic killer suppression protein